MSAPGPAAGTRPVRVPGPLGRAPGALRAVGAAGLLLTSAVHLYLYWAELYRLVPTIGPLFLMAGIVAAVLGVTVLAVRNPLVDTFAAGFAAAVLGGYALALLLPHGIFGFAEPGVFYSGALAIAGEVAAGAALALSAARGLLAWRSRRRSVVPVRDAGPVGPLGTPADADEESRRAAGAPPPPARDR